MYACSFSRDAPMIKHKYTLLRAPLVLSLMYSPSSSLVSRMCMEYAIFRVCRSRHRSLHRAMSIKSSNDVARARASESELDMITLRAELCFGVCFAVYKFFRDPGKMEPPTRSRTRVIWKTRSSKFALKNRFQIGRAHV